MRYLAATLCSFLVTTATSVEPSAAAELAPSLQPTQASSSMPGVGAQSAGRFQIVVVSGHAGSPFLIDTTTGCVWHQIQNQDTKRTTFVEVDVENLHWSWGSGSQQVLAARVDGANVSEEQKRVLKDSLQKTACGISNVVLTPGPPNASSPSSGSAGKP